MKQLEMNPEFMHRYLNEGFSGGEKKRNEILQMMLLEPKLLFWMKLTPVLTSMHCVSWLKV